jgi:hypothetical protein
MKRFLMFVGVAVVAAAMYVAASPASQQSRGPTAKQFKALKKQVATLSKTLKATKSEADAAVAFISTCFISANAGVLPINEFGDPAGAFGYQYTDNGTDIINVTALDVDTSAPFEGAYLQAVDPACVNTTGLRHRQAHAGSSRLPLLAEHAAH